MKPEINVEKENEELYEEHHYTADPGQEPMRVDKFLLNKMESITRNKLQNGIKDGFVSVNGKKIKANHKVKPGDKILVRWKKTWRTPATLPEDIPLDIRYEDDDVMVVYKPSGMIVHPGIGNYSGTIVNALMYYLNGTELIESEHERPGIVHRIDKNTTGLLVIGKTEQAMSHLAKQFFDHTVERRYRALVWGYVDNDEGTITGHIDRHQRNRKLRCVYPEGDRGKHAVTHYKVLKRYGYVTLIECQLETGRTHQIRVHFQHIGHPLFGDIEYGGDRIVKGTVFTKYRRFVNNCFQVMPYQALHAFSLGFKHPKTEERIYLEAPLPDNFKEVLDRWDRYTEGRLKK
ncbi:MAG: RluA family pseudouridine synthase [Saprospiraceae bacterium]|nr:RluA family pseudouridine synthase [Saprospiraceae bacterium]